VPYVSADVCAFQTRSGLAHLCGFHLMIGMLLCMFNFMFVQIKHHPVHHEQLLELVGVLQFHP
jgi:hypothetical protein